MKGMETFVGIYVRVLQYTNFSCFQLVALYQNYSCHQNILYGKPSVVLNLSECIVRASYNKF